MSTELTTATANVPANTGCFGDFKAIAQAAEFCDKMCRSDVIPENYRGNAANCLIALDVALRMQLSPLAVMQNLNVIYGRPSWSGQFYVAAINRSGMFSRLKFDFESLGKKKFPARKIYTKKGGTIEVPAFEVEDMRCRATAVELATGQKLDGPWVSVGLAVEEGWYNKDGSKWKTMPEIMLRYRAASFFGKFFCPEITMGLLTSEEAVDRGTSEQDTIELPALNYPVKAEVVEQEPKKEEPTQEPKVKDIEELLAPIKMAGTIEELRKSAEKIKNDTELTEEDKDALRKAYAERQNHLNKQAKQEQAKQPAPSPSPTPKPEAKKAPDQKPGDTVEFYTTKIAKAKTNEDFAEIMNMMTQDITNGLINETESEIIDEAYQERYAKMCY